MARRTSAEWNSESRASRLQADARGVPSNIMMPRIVLIVCTAALVLLGLVMVFSASSVESLSDGGGVADEFVKQLAIACGSVVVCALFAHFATLHFLKTAGLAFAWIGSVALLVLVLLVGTEELGATRWLVIAGFTLQPSEFAKIAFVLMGAKIMYDYSEELKDWKHTLLAAGGLVVLPLLFMYKTQSDMGTFAITAVALFTVMWLGGVPVRYMLSIVGVGAVVLVLGSVTGYRSDRISVWLNPWLDQYGTGFQSIHSFYAFAEGGLFGVGLGNSREKFLYLPEAETDMIFSVIGEELGLIGALAVIALFLVFLYAGLRIAHECPDPFGRMAAGGLTVAIVVQAFLNKGCAIGALPVTGKPLPFISSGGSSLLTTFIMVGIILAISYDSNKLTESERRRNDLVVISGGANRGSGGARDLPGSGSGNGARRDRAASRRIASDGSRGARTGRRGSESRRDAPRRSGSRAGRQGARRQDPSRSNRHASSSRRPRR